MPKNNEAPRSFKNSDHIVVQKGENSVLLKKNDGETMDKKQVKSDSAIESAFPFFSPHFNVRNPLINASGKTKSFSPAANLTRISFFPLSKLITCPFPNLL